MKEQRKGSHRAIAALLAAASIGIAGMAHSATTIRLGWTTADSEADPYAIVAHNFAEELDAAAPGEFNVEFFPNHQLGNDHEMLQGMQLGSIDAGVITGTQLGSLDPAFQLNDLPFLYENEKQAHKILDGEIGQALLSRLESHGIVGLGFPEAGARHVVNNVRPIVGPANLQGVKLRVQPSGLFISSFRAMGANPAPIAWSDAFTAVQQGTVDGLEIPLPVIYANKYPEVTQYLSLTNHTYNALALLISKQTFDGLSAEQQETVRNAARTAIERQRKTVAGNNDEILAKIIEAGMEVNEIENVAQFRERVAPVYEIYRDKIGPELFDRTLELVSE